MISPIKSLIGSTMRRTGSVVDPFVHREGDPSVTFFQDRQLGIELRIDRCRGV